MNMQKPSGPLGNKRGVGFGILLIGLLTMAADRQLGRLIARTVGRWARV